MGQLEQFLSDIAPNGDWQPLIDYINQNYVSKKSINNKIEELEEIIKKKRQLNIKEWVGFEENEIEILEELLEEN